MLIGVSGSSRCPEAAIRFLGAFFVTTILFAPRVAPHQLSVFSDAHSLRGEAGPDHVAAPVDAYYVMNMAERFMNFSRSHMEAQNMFHNSEQDRIEAAIQDATDLTDKSLLEATATANEESRMETQNAFGAMQNFMTTLKQAMGSKAVVTSCEDLTCSSNAFCAMSRTNGARCLCKEGFQGDGFSCGLPSEFKAHALIQFTANQPVTQVADLHISTLQGNNLAVVYRDAADLHKGYLVVGHADASHMRWNTPVLFSKDSQAYGPVLVQCVDSPAIAIAYRDQNTDGRGVLLSGVHDSHGNQVTLGDAKAFARRQAQGMQLLALPNARVAVLFSETTPGKLSGSAVVNGAALLVELDSFGGPLKTLGKYRFASGPVARLSATMLSPTSFVVAYRQGEARSGERQAEAACAFGQVDGNSLVFDPSPLLLDPERTQIWSRSVMLIEDNTFAYTYHSGAEQLSKQAIVRVDPVTHKMRVVHGPEVIGHGFSPFVGMVAAVAPLRDPKHIGLAERAAHTIEVPSRGRRFLTILGNGGGSDLQARACEAAVDGSLKGCQKFSWSKQEVASVSGAPVGDGRIILAFTDMKGGAFYQFVGL